MQSPPLVDASCFSEPIYFPPLFSAFLRVTLSFLGELARLEGLFFRSSRPRQVRLIRWFFFACILFRTLSTNFGLSYCEQRVPASRSPLPPCGAAPLPRLLGLCGPMPPFVCHCSPAGSLLPQQVPDFFFLGTVGRLAMIWSLLLQFFHFAPWFLLF